MKLYAPRSALGGQLSAPAHQNRSPRAPRGSIQESQGPGGATMHFRKIQEKSRLKHM